MGGIYFLGFTVGVLLVIWWSFKNDERRPGQPTEGLFAIADVATVKKEAVRTKKQNRARALKWRRFKPLS